MHFIFFYAPWIGSMGLYRYVWDLEKIVGQNSPVFLLANLSIEIPVREGEGTLPVRVAHIARGSDKCRNFRESRWDKDKGHRGGER